MANIKELKKRIRSTKSTLKITTAMKLVSAAKMARAQDSIVNSRPFASELEETIKVTSALIENYTHPYLVEGSSERSVILIISSNKGLCGGYNAQLARKVTSELNNLEEGSYQIHGIGKKLYELFKAKNLGPLYKFEKSDPNFSEIKKLANDLGKLFISGEFGRLYVAFNTFNSALSFTPTVKQLLPMKLNEGEKHKLREQYPFDFKYDIPPEELLNELIPQVLETMIFTSVLDGLASEHSSRMSAMDSASKNCKDMIRTLTLKMNKLRQAAITTELIEVVSGAEALNG